MDRVLDGAHWQPHFVTRNWSSSQSLSNDVRYSRILRPVPGRVYRLDGAAVARLFAVPSGIASDRGYTHWPTYEAVERNISALCELYRANGYRSASFTPSSFIAQGNDFAVADIRWRIERANDQPRWEFHTTYNLMRTRDGWRILLCTAYEERRLNAV